MVAAGAGAAAFWGRTGRGAGWGQWPGAGTRRRCVTPAAHTHNSILLVHHPRCCPLPGPALPAPPSQPPSPPPPSRGSPLPPPAHLCSTPPPPRGSSPHPKHTPRSLPTTPPPAPLRTPSAPPALPPQSEALARSKLASLERSYRELQFSKADADRQRGEAEAALHAERARTGGAKTVSELQQLVATLQATVAHLQQRARLDKVRARGRGGEGSCCCCACRALSMGSPAQAVGWLVAAQCAEP